MTEEEYRKVMDAKMREIATIINNINAPTELRNAFTKLGADVKCTDTGVVMETAIEVAHELIKSIYKRAKHSHMQCGIDKMIECQIKGDPFYGDILTKEE